MQISLKNYQKSLSKISKIIDETKQKIVKSVDYQKVVMSWKIGEEIEEHLKDKKENGYGEKFFSELEKDTKIAQRTLYRMQAFHKTYPTLPTPESKLNWSHYRTLSAVKNEKTRKYLESLAIENDLGAQRLEKAAAKSKARKELRKTSEKKPAKKLKFTRGKLFTYTKTKEGEADLGFNTFLTSPPTVIASKAKQSSSRIQMDCRASLAMTVVSKGEFTYVAELERVVDGDTLHVKLDLGFGIKHREILRLAKINAAESETKEGKKATAELKKILKDVPFLIVKTNKTDIYGRYVADVFFGKGSAEEVAEKGDYLNQLLLDRELVELY